VKVFKNKFLAWVVLYIFILSPTGVLAQAPQAFFSVNPGSGTLSAPAGVQFTDTSTGNPTYWFWEFGDGRYRQVQNPLYVYEQPGTYPVTLTVGNADGLDTVTLVGDYTVQTCGDIDFLISEGEDSSLFTSIMDAYRDSIYTDISLQLKASPYIEDLIFDDETVGTVELKGGYGCGFLDNLWGTPIGGTLIIRQGTVKPFGVTIAPPSSLREVCDGNDNDGDGNIDSPLAPQP